MIPTPARMPPERLTGTAKRARCPKCGAWKKLKLSWRTDPDSSGSYIATYTCPNPQCGERFTLKHE